MRRVMLALVFVFLFAFQAQAGNIFIEEGDLYTDSGIAVDFDGDMDELARVHILMGKVDNIEQFKQLGLNIDLEIGQKLKLLNKGDGEWEILDLASEKPLGVLSKVIVQ